MTKPVLPTATISVFGSLLTGDRKSLCYAIVSHHQIKERGGEEVESLGPTVNCMQHDVITHNYIPFCHNILSIFTRPYLYPMVGSGDETRA